MKYQMWIAVAALGLVGCKSKGRDNPPMQMPMAMPDAGATPPPTADDAGGMMPACSLPAAPFGTDIGRKLEPFTLETCDGTPYEFYNDEYCSTTFTVISIAAGWCVPCQEESMVLSDTITEPYRERGVRVLQILVQDEDYLEPDAQFCNRWVSTYNLTNVELLDPMQITSIYFPTNSLPETIVVDGRGVIRFRESGSTQGLGRLRTALDGLLAEIGR